MTDNTGAFQPSSETDATPEYVPMTPFWGGIILRTAQHTLAGIEDPEERRHVPEATRYLWGAADTLIDQQPDAKVDMAATLEAGKAAWLGGKTGAAEGVVPEDTAAAFSLADRHVQQSYDRHHGEQESLLTYPK
jgi:hypothetical protein